MTNQPNLITKNQNTPIIVYSQKEQKEFAEKFIWPVIDLVSSEQFPDNDINERIKEEYRMVRARFRGKMPVYITLLEYHPLSKLVAGSSVVATKGSNESRVRLYVPALINMYHSHHSQDDDLKQGMFQRFVVWTIMHELDHLSETPEIAQAPSIADEIHIHALTVKYVTTVFVEKYHLPLHDAMTLEYGAWIAAGRDEMNPIWQDYIRKLHLNLIQ